MKSGISPRLLREQVKQTAGWLWTDGSDARAARVTAAVDRQEEDAKAASLELLLAAHFATVATFVPTDVDARIRHHAWQAIEDAEALEAACSVVDEVTSWDVHLVTDRAVTSDAGPLSGHDGEWFSVRAGALCRAGQLGASAQMEKLVAQLDAEVDREDRIATAALQASTTPEGAARALRVTTIIAHNLGDLSRVVDAWPKHPDLEALRSRFSRLGHEDSQHGRPALRACGTINKAIMALENHRFLALRKVRCLRSSRSLLLPIGPYFDVWGEKLAVSEHLSDKERAEVVAALLEIHASSPEQQGCLRALSGLHRKTRGGLELYVPDLPARLRKDALRGKVRDALDVTPEHFAVRMERRLRAVSPAMLPVR